MGIVLILCISSEVLALGCRAYCSAASRQYSENETLAVAAANSIFFTSTSFNITLLVIERADFVPRIVLGFLRTVIMYLVHEESNGCGFDKSLMTNFTQPSSLSSAPIPPPYVPAVSSGTVASGFDSS